MKSRRLVATRLIVASVVLLALFIVLAAVAYLNGRIVERQSVLISSDAVPGTIDAHAIRGAISRSMGYSMLASMTDNPATDNAAFAKITAADRLFRDTLERYRGTILIDPTKDRALVDNLTAKWSVYLQKRAEFEALIRSGKRTESYPFLVAQVLPLYEAAVDAAEQLLAYNHSNTLLYANTIEKDIRILRWTVVIVLILAAFCVVIVLVNLKLRLAQQREVLESERRLRQVLDNLFVFVGVLDLDYTVIEANRVPLEAAGIKRDEVMGKRFDQTHWWTRSPEKQRKLQDSLRDAAAGTTVRYDVELAGKDDTLLTVDFGCGPLYDSGGRVSQLVVTAVDISERKKLEQQFLRAQRMEALGTLSSGLAHDLNNILAPMLMGAALLKGRLEAPGDQRIVTMIEDSAQRGADIIRQLLTFGRGTAGTQVGVQVRLLVKDMVHLIEETFPRRIELEHTAPPTLWTVTANTTQLHQVLLNLCVNARDAMPEGGKLTIVAENIELSEESAKSIPQAKAGLYVVLSVADTGEGIPPAIINRIFDAFFTTKPVGKGTGLGLASVLGIAKSHGGFVTVASKPGEGTVFKVYLPADQQAVAAHTEAPVDKLPRGQGEMILLAEDEAKVRETTKEILELHNYRVITAANGEEAVRLFVDHRETIKVVVTDVDMPLMGGVELIRSIRILERETLFLVMSGSVHADNEAKLARLGVSEIIAKPCDPARLLNALQSTFQTLNR